MLDPNEDTEWNDVLRAKGIIPQKEKGITEEEIVAMMEKTIEEKQNKKEKELSELDLDGLDELEDSEDEAVLAEYRKKRIAEMMALSAKAKFGKVFEISAREYVDEVNKAGDDIWVVLHLYEQGIQLCALLNQFLNELAVRFPATKFIKAISTTCIPNYPEKNVPSIFIYYEGQIKKQIIGPIELRGDKLTAKEFEYMLGLYGAIQTDIKEDPRQGITDKMFADLAENNDW